MHRLLVNIRFALSALALLALVACVDLNPAPPPSQGRVSTTPPASAANAPPSAQAPQPSPALPTFPTNVPVVRIALLLPMSGDSQALGQSMLDAATLALHDAYMPLKAEQIRARLVLIPKDTGAAPSAAADAAEQVLKQDVKLIIGPLYGASVGAVGPVAKQHGVPVLSLSNNRAVASPGVYVFGFLPEQQVQRVAEYAARMNVQTIGALLPNDAYGDMVSTVLKSSLTARGIRIDPVEMYGRSTGSNLDAAVVRLKAGYDKTPFKALFIADGSDQLKQTLDALKAQGLGNKTLRLLGTGLWDDEAVRALPDMEGAWFASSPPQYYATFERHFTAAYGYKPQRLASLTYDAVTLAANLALAAGGPDFGPQAFTAPQGFVGPGNGPYRLKADGTSERSLAVMEISNGALKIVDGAPPTFDTH